MTRWRLLNGAAVLATGQLALAGAILWRAGAPGVFGGDFIAYDGVARQIVARGWSGLYDLGVQIQYQRDLLAASGLPASRPAAIPFNYPPPAALLVLPFAALPPRLAVVLWVGLNLALALVATRLALRAGAANGAGRPWPVAALLFLPLDWGLLAGQPVGVMLLLSTITLRGLLRRQDALAGGSLALLAAIKPQLAVAPALGLLVLRRGRAVAAALAVGLALLLLSLLLVGVDGLRAYLRLLTTMDGFSGNAALAVQAGAMTNWRAWLLRLPGLGATAGFWLALALDGLTLLAALVPLARLRGGGPRDAARTLAFGWLTLTGAGILASYHSHYQDLVLLLPPALYLAPGVRASAAWGAGWRLKSRLQPSEARLRGLGPSRRGAALLVAGAASVDAAGRPDPPLGWDEAPAPPIAQRPGDLTSGDRPWRQAQRMGTPAAADASHAPRMLDRRPPPRIGGPGGPRPAPARWGSSPAASSVAGPPLQQAAGIAEGRRIVPDPDVRAPSVRSRGGAVAAGAAIVCLGMPCLIWLAGGVLAFAALSLWAALAGLGLAALAILPVLHARPDGDLPRLRPSEQAAPSGAIAAPAGVDS